MKLTTYTLALTFACLSQVTLITTSLGAEGLAAPVQAKLDAMAKEIQTWASDATIVSAVKAQNSSLPADCAGSR